MTNAQMNQILLETVKTFGNQQWFRDAKVYDQHPMTGEPTLEFKVNYLPLFEKKSVITFAQKCNIAYRFQVVDRNGNPAE